VAAVGQFLWVTLHEAGHAIFDILDVSIFGHPEDAADNFATYVMLQFGKGQAQRLIGGAAWAWYAVPSVALIMPAKLRLMINPRCARTVRHLMAARSKLPARSGNTIRCSFLWRRIKNVLQKLVADGDSWLRTFPHVPRIYHVTFPSLDV